MIWSEAEILTLATKAARGAGAPPEQAARFGQAAVAHLHAGRGEAALIAALDALPDGRVLTHLRRIDAVLSAADEVAIPNPDADRLSDSHLDALPFLASGWATPKGLVFDINLAAPRERLGPQRITGCSRLIRQMTDLAKAILVPESEASRRAGAGAGLSDND